VCLIAVACECIHGDQLKIHQGPTFSTRMLDILLSVDPQLLNSRYLYVHNNLILKSVSNQRNITNEKPKVVVTLGAIS
jgi:hypothetical protein